MGDILDKAMEVQATRVNDWLEAEIVRLSHLRDRASEKGRKKELRECVEKLQLLKTLEERRRRLEENPEVHADPNMDPSYESEEVDCEMDDNKQEIYTRPRGSGFSRKGKEPISPRRGSFSSIDSRKNSGKNWELNRNMSSEDFLNKGEEATLVDEIPGENAWNQGRDNDTQVANNMKVNSASNSDTVGRNSHSFVRSESFTGAASETSRASLSAGVEETATKISETEKIWRYKNPSGKVQGPFSVVQLRKWNNTGYFPADLRIWRTTENQDNSVLLADALAGRFPKELPSMDNNSSKTQVVDSSHLSSAHAQKPYGASLQEEGRGGERLNFDQSHGARNSQGNLGPSNQSSRENWRSQQGQQSSSSADNPNAGWGPMQGNATMGWGGPAHGTTNMNWGAAVQGPVPGTVNPGWVPSTGNPGAIIQGPVQVELLKQVIQDLPQGRDSGFCGAGSRPWNRQPSFGSGSKPIVCKHHRSGHCKKGASCDLLHT